MKKLLFALLVAVCAMNAAVAQVKENLVIAWPGEYKWKTVMNQQTAAANMIELIPGNQALNNWALMATMMSYKNMRVPSIAKVPPMLLTKMRQTGPAAKLTVLESGVKMGRQWTIFKIETPTFTTTGKPESQLYYAIQGDRTLYVTFVALKEKFFPTISVMKWTSVFKSSQLVTK